MSDVRIEIVRHPVDRALEDELGVFWLAERALTSIDDVRRRASQAAAIARDPSGRLIAVSTTQPRRIRPFDQDLRWYRCFVARAWRGSGVARKLLVAVTQHFDREFAEGRDRSTIGIFFVAENQELGRLLLDAVTQPFPYVFCGFTARGQQTRVCYFRGARISPATATPNERGNAAGRSDAEPE